jgi:hypothetical protein
MTTFNQLADQLETDADTLRAFVEANVDVANYAVEEITTRWWATKEQADTETSEGLSHAMDADAAAPDALSGADDAEVTPDAAEAQPRTAYL